jgi:hypothetical protein
MRSRTQRDPLAESYRLMEGGDGPALWQAMADRANEIIRPPTDEMGPEIDRLEGSLYEFEKAAWHVMEPSRPFIDGWHLGCVAEHLSAVYSLEIQNLILATPPGFTKSLSLCVFWPAWVWAKEPGFQWFFAAYGGELSTRDQRRMRQLINSDWYRQRWGTKYRVVKEGLTKFDNDAMGFRIATSIRGRGTGEHVDAAVVDDALKAKDGRSRVAKEEVRNWWDRTMPTRGNNPATFRRVISGQRLAEDDLTGHALSSGEPYETLILPMRYEPKRYFFPAPGDLRPTEVVKAESPAASKRDVIVPTVVQRKRPEWIDPRTEDGELLWPAMFPEMAVAALFKTLHNDAPGQLQQRPTAAEGNIIKADDFRYFYEEVGEDGLAYVVLGETDPTGRPAPRVLRESLRFFQTCDTAMEAGEENDYTAICTWALAQVRDGDAVVGRYLLLWEAVQLKLTIPQQWPFLVRQRRRWPGLILQAVEKKASGHQMIQQGAADGLPVYPLNPGTKDKVARSALIAGLYRAHLVFHRSGARPAVCGDAEPGLPAAADGLVDYEDQVVNAPNSSYLDLFDCCAYAGILFTYEKILSSNVIGDLNGSPYGGTPGTTREVQGGEITAVEIGPAGEAVEVYWPEADEATGWGRGRR